MPKLKPFQVGQVCVAGKLGPSISNIFYAAVSDFKIALVDD